MDVKCKISGRGFEVSAHEMALRKKFGFGDSLPKILPKYRFQYLGAFWPQWNLHKRKCDKTGEQIISVFRPDCVYPVWKRKEWFENNNPPSKDFDPSVGFFDQAWELFQKCPIPHVFENNNQNCEYTDDWYYSKNCYLLSKHENCANDCFSGPAAKGTLDSVGTVGGELTFMSSLPVFSYYVIFSFSVSHCKFVEYCAYLQNCQYCFGCCGLVNKKYCIFNKQYSEKEYEILREKIISQMKKSGEWGKFFPGYFAPNPYEESFSGFHFPLDKPSDLGFREGGPVERKNVKTAEIEDIPDSLKDLNSEKEKWLTEQIFWDEKYKRSFQVTQKDVDFAKRIKGPLPHDYYVHRLQYNFLWMPFNGELRDTVCAKSGVKIKTNWPEKFDGRILCEEEYLKVVK